MADPCLRQPAPARMKGYKISSYFVAVEIARMSNLFGDLSELLHSVQAHQPSCGQAGKDASVRPAKRLRGQIRHSETEGIGNLILRAVNLLGLLSMETGGSIVVYMWQGGSQ